MNDDTAIDVYWRPGCPFCMSLTRGLRRRGIPMRMHNIWEDPDAAAEVRRVARGNETVPTVRVGGRFHVNPTASAVMDLLASDSPATLQDARPRRRWWQRSDPAEPLASG